MNVEEALTDLSTRVVALRKQVKEMNDSLPPAVDEVPDQEAIS